MTTTRELALFDLDGTLTTHDTMFDFVGHARGRARLLAGLIALSPWLVAHRLGFLSAEEAKKRLLRWFFAGESRARLDALGEAYAERLEALLRPAALARLEHHRTAGHDVLVVSASADLWVAAWAKKRGLTVLCTGIRFEEDVFAGDLATPNCNGAEKERRIRAAVDPEGYDVVHAYGDSDGDREMLELADEVWYRPFRGPS